MVAAVSLALYAAVAASPVAPSSEAVKRAIFTLTRAEDGLKDLELSLNCTGLALKGTSQVYDHLVFHEGNVDAADKKRLETKYPGLRFVDAREHGGFETDVAFEPDEWSLGYRQMCEFMSLKWFEALANYEVAMRVDEDVCLLHFETDPFDEVSKPESVYAYGLLTAERHDRTRATLTPWLRQYVSEHEVLSKDIDADTMYFTNFFVSRPNFWKNSAVADYLSAIATSGGIFEHRWGDAPIQTAALRMFAPESAVSHMKMDYAHLSTHNFIHNGEEVKSDMIVDSVMHPSLRRMLAAHNGTNGTVPAAPGIRTHAVQISLTLSMSTTEFTAYQPTFINKMAAELSLASPGNPVAESDITITSVVPASIIVSMSVATTSEALANTMKSHIEARQASGALSSSLGVTVTGVTVTVVAIALPGGSGMSTGAIVGIAVGASVGGLVMIGVGMKMMMGKGGGGGGYGKSVSPQAGCATSATSSSCAN